MEVNLSLDYPRRAPQCRMLTPVFHPNFDDSQVCIGAFWAASEGLDDLVVRIGRMICYQEYNTVCTAFGKNLILKFLSRL
jgi:ubiquitin-protein ligase